MIGWKRTNEKASLVYVQSLSCTQIILAAEGGVSSSDVEAVKFLMLPLPAPLEVLCFRVRFRFLTFGIFCFRLWIELVTSEFASASSLFHQSGSASTKI